MPANDIIVVGASAGGVDALKHLVCDLPPDLPAALFVVLHIGAHPSIIPEILRKAGPLPAAHAIDGTAIENGRIYIAPPDHHLFLAPGHMHLTRGPKENNARPSINTLFRTAAAAYRDRVAGVVLTGTLNDGTVGLWEIKRHGGITIVQDPIEAAYPAMPRSALENVEIDYSLPVSEMASLLKLLATGNRRNKRMETEAARKTDKLNFSGLTCPECRGPLWEQVYGKLREFRCRVGHVYSFEVLLEQHAATTERTLWTVILALEEEVVLMHHAAQDTLDGAAQQDYERKAQTKEKQATTIREMLTQPDPTFGQTLAREVHNAGKCLRCHRS